MLTKLSETDPLSAWLEEANAQRQVGHWMLNVPVRLSLAGRRHRGVILDVSTVGVLVRLSNSAGPAPGSFVELTPRGYHAIPGKVRLSLRGGRLVGLELLHEPSEQSKLVAWLGALDTQTVH